MKVILDANVLISYLLTFRPSDTIPRVVEWCLLHPGRLVVPVELVQEIADAIARKPYLRERIPLARLNLMFERLLASASVASSLQEYGSYSADVKDDYLVAYGLVQQVDYLITGDAGLLALRRVQTLEIVDPYQFLILLQQQGLIDA